MTEKMIRKAESAYEAIINLVDIKQRQGKLFYAVAIKDLMRSKRNWVSKSSQGILNSTNQPKQQSEKSGDTLMVVSPLPGR